MVWTLIAVTCVTFLSSQQKVWWRNCITLFFKCFISMINDINGGIFVISAFYQHLSIIQVIVPYVPWLNKITWDFSPHMLHQIYNFSCIPIVTKSLIISFEFCNGHSHFPLYAFHVRFALSLCFFFVSLSKSFSDNKKLRFSIVIKNPLHLSYMQCTK